MTRRIPKICFLIVFAFLLILSGCSTCYLGSQNRITSSVVEYLYPNEEVIVAPTVPSLSLPLDVGIAFVPGSAGRYGKPALSRKDKQDLMARIASEFRSLSFVRTIELIPSDYLTEGGGFTNLNQIKVMFDIDVIALISYDQVQHTDEGMLSLSYLTLVGAYTLKGEKNDTSTMVDAVVYDIPSRKMLFRAPGTSHVQGSATWINLSEQLRVDSLKGFDSATENLVSNLQFELTRFKEKVKQRPESYTVNNKPGYTGGGSLGGGYAIMLLLLGGAGLWLNKKE